MFAGRVGERMNKRATRPVLLLLLLEAMQCVLVELITLMHRRHGGLPDAAAAAPHRFYSAN